MTFVSGRLALLHKKAHPKKALSFDKTCTCSDQQAGWKRMKSVAACFLLAIGTVAVTTISSGAQGPLNEKQLLGMRLFNQSCRVCHTKPQVTSGQYGPVLSKNSLAGDETAIRDFIMNGTPRMPGFKYSYEPAQIDAIVGYLKTVPAP